MPQLLDQILENPQAAAAWAQLSPDEKQEVLTALYPERPHRPSALASDAPQPTFLERLGNPREAAAMAVDFLPGLVPGPVGAVGAGLGSLGADAIRGEPLDWGRAGTQAALTGVLGGLGKLAKPLSKLRIAGTGRAADAELAADAVRGAGTALQPQGTAADLMRIMRGKPGEQAMGAAKDFSDEMIAKQLPRAPKPIDKTTREYLDAQVAQRAPADPVPPALSREDYLARTKELSDLGNRGFNKQGMFRDSPEAVEARRLHGEKLGELKDKVTEQGGPRLRREVERGRRDYSAATELRRLFRGNTGEGPDRVFRPGGFSLQDVQERAGKRVNEIQGRLGKDEGDELLRKLYRGGRPGEGTDHPLNIGMSKFKGFSIPTGLEVLAGPGMDPRLIQMLLQGGGGGLLDLLDER